jgi:hypothetical protein
MKILLALLPLVMFLGVSCSLSSEDGDMCIILSECQSSIPSSATLNLRLSPGFDEIEVRAGTYFESGRTLYRGSQKQSFVLPLGDYAVRVRYVNGPDTILAFDGGNLGYSSREECEETCYEADDVTLDLALGPGVWKK